MRRTDMHASRFRSDRSAELFRQRLQLLASGHQVLQFVDANLVLGIGSERLAAVEHREAVANGIGVTDVVGDEDHAEALGSDLV